MIFYKHLYVGEKAEKKKDQILERLKKKEFQPGIYVIMPPANPENLLDILPAYMLIGSTETKENPDRILGIAAGKGEAMELAGKILGSWYRKNGSFRRKWT